jgi:hypothetical protein
VSENCLFKLVCELVITHNASRETLNMPDEKATKILQLTQIHEILQVIYRKAHRTAFDFTVLAVMSTAEEAVQNDKKQIDAMYEIIDKELPKLQIRILNIIRNMETSSNLMTQQELSNYFINIQNDIKNMLDNIKVNLVSAAKNILIKSQQKLEEIADERETKFSYVPARILLDWLLELTSGQFTELLEWIHQIQLGNILTQNQASQLRKFKQSATMRERQRLRRQTHATQLSEEQQRKQAKEKRRREKEQLAKQPVLPTFPPTIQDASMLHTNAGSSHGFEIFHDDNDAGIWIERVCNRFIQQKLNLLFKEIESQLQKNKLNKYFEDNENYQQELASEQKKREIGSILKYMDENHPEIDKKERLKEFNKLKLAEKKKAKQHIPPYENWRKNALRRKYLSFYQFFQKWQYKLIVMPVYERDNEKHTMKVQIIQKNRSQDLESQWYDRKVIYELETEKTSEYQLSSNLTCEGHIDIDALSNLHDIFSDVHENIEMYCLQALFHAHFSMLEYYMYTLKGKTEWSIDECRRNIFDFQYFDDDFQYIDDDFDDDDLREFKENLFVSSTMTFGQSVRSFEIFASNDAFYFTNMDFATEFNDDIYDSNNPDTISNSIVQLDTVEFDIEDTYGMIQNVFEELRGTNGISLETHDLKLALSLPLKNTCMEALKEGIMFAPTAKATHEMDKIPHVMPWKAYDTHAFQCPGWAWFEILKQLHEADFKFSNIESDFKSNQDLVNEDGEFKNDGVFYLLQALAEYGPYDIMTFGDQNMNIMTQFISCSMLHLQETMINMLQRLTDDVVPQIFTINALNLVCNCLVEKSQRPPKTQASVWWNACSLETVGPDKDFLRARALDKFWFENNNLQILEPYNENDKKSVEKANWAMTFAVCMLMAHEMLVLEWSHNPAVPITKTRIYEILDVIFQAYTCFADQTQTLEVVVREKKEEIQKNINETFYEYINSPAGKAILGLFGFSATYRNSLTSNPQWNVAYAGKPGQFVNALKSMIHNLTEDTINIPNIDPLMTVHQKVRALAWQKMVACRIEAKRKATIARQKQGNPQPKNPKKEIGLNTALMQNNYVNLVHSILRQLKMRLTEDTMYHCFIDNCCQLQKLPFLIYGDDNPGVYVMGGMQLWMPVILYHSKTFIAEDYDPMSTEFSQMLMKNNWQILIEKHASQLNKMHETEPRLEIAIDLLVLARQFFEDNYLYDDMLRVKTDIHKTNRIQNTIAPPEEIIK